MAALLAALVACNKEPQQVTPEDVDGKVYMQFSVNMLTTRSGTNTPDNGDYGTSDATPGVEVGFDYENKISTVDIVLVNGSTRVVADNVVPAQASTDTYVASFNTTALTASTTYQVYVYANCENVTDLDAVSNVAVTAMTENNKFWMTNAYEAGTTTLPADLSLYTVPQNPLNLGEHFVERAMARFDYMPINNNKYSILKKDNSVNATVTLTKAALINHSKEFYMLRRTSTDGTNTNWTIGGVETAANYVVDTDWEAKKEGYTDAQVANFDAHLTAPATWTWKSIAVADLTEKDNWKGTDDGTTGVNPAPTHGLNEYYKWQYAKENTIPGVTAQQHGISTGVVFKGEITGAAVEAANGEMIYVFENVLYGKWSAVETAAVAADAPATLVAAVNKIKAIVDNPETTDVVEAPTAADYAAAGFTGYNPDKTDHKYYAYYYYWNRHNDNADNTKMDNMEFAVVRNNVYKLCVDKIAKFGHPDPTDPQNPDPDPVVPNDPDEDINYYFTVTVKVLPWVVRVNHIEF